MSAPRTTMARARASDRSKRSTRTATVGAAENGASVVLVTIATDGEALDRRTIELVERGMSTHPHHHEGSWAVGRYTKSPWARAITLPEAVALVERVRTCAARRAAAELEALSASVPLPIVALALRAYAPLPATIEERIRDARAQAYADTAMYREALATAARERGWSVSWYERESVDRDAAKALGTKDLDAALAAMRRALGPPWQARHKLAATAALAARVRQRST